jgi:hypothetical protein
MFDLTHSLPLVVGGAAACLVPYSKKIVSHERIGKARRFHHLVPLVHEFRADKVTVHKQPPAPRLRR